MKKTVETMWVRDIIGQDSVLPRCPPHPPLHSQEGLATSGSPPLNPKKVDETGYLIKTIPKKNAYDSGSFADPKHFQKSLYWLTHWSPGLGIRACYET